MRDRCVGAPLWIVDYEPSGKMFCLFPNSVVIMRLCEEVFFFGKRHDGFYTRIQTTDTGTRQDGYAERMSRSRGQSHPLGGHRDTSCGGRVRILVFCVRTVERSVADRHGVRRASVTYSRCRSLGASVYASCSLRLRLMFAGYNTCQQLFLSFVLYHGVKVIASWTVSISC